MNDVVSRYRVANLYLRPSNERSTASQTEGAQPSDWDLSMVDFRPKPGDGFYFDGEYDPRVFEPCETDAERMAEDRRVREAEQAVEWGSRAITPLTDHLASLGAIRADGGVAIVLNDDEGGCGAEFLFVYEDSPEASGHLASLGNLEAVAAEISCHELAGFRVFADFCPAEEGQPISVQALFDALPKLELSAGVGVWGGTGTPERLPQVGEALNDWLGRVALSETDLAAMAERWEAVGPRHRAIQGLWHASGWRKRARYRMARSRCACERMRHVAGRYEWGWQVDDCS